MFRIDIIEQPEQPSLSNQHLKFKRKALENLYFEIFHVDGVCFQCKYYTIDGSSKFRLQLKHSSCENPLFKAKISLFELSYLAPTNTL